MPGRGGLSGADSCPLSCLSFDCYCCPYPYCYPYPHCYPHCYPYCYPYSHS